MQRDYLIPRIIVFLSREKEVDNACLTHARGPKAVLGAYAKRNSKVSMGPVSWKAVDGCARAAVSNIALSFELKFPG